MPLPIDGYAREFEDAQEMIEAARALRQKLRQPARDPASMTHGERMQERDWLDPSIDRRRRAYPEMVLDVIAEAYDVSVGEIIGDDRAEKIMRARKAACWLLHEHSQLSFNRIGAIIRKHHSNVMAHVRTVARCEPDSPLRRRLDSLNETLFVRAK